MKKIMISFLISLLLLSSLPTAVSADTDPGAISLQAAVELAKQYSSQAKQAELSVSLASYNSNLAYNALVDALYYSGYGVYSVSTITSIRKTAESSEQAYEKAAESLASQIEAIGFTTSSLYLSTLLLEKQIEIAREAVALNESALKIEEVKQGLGLATAQSVADKEQALLTSRKNLQSYIDFASANKKTLNNLLGHDADAPLLLQRPIISDTGEPKPWTEVVKLALATNVDLKHKEIAINDRISDRLDAAGASNSYEIADINLQNAQILLDESIFTLKQDVKNNYDKVNTARVALREKLMNNNNGYKNYVFAKTKHALGLISDIEFDNEYITFLGKEIDLQSTENTYLLAKIAYELAEQGIIIK